MGWIEDHKIWNQQPRKTLIKKLFYRKEKKNFQPEFPGKFEISAEIGELKAGWCGNHEIRNQQPRKTFIIEFSENMKK